MVNAFKFDLSAVEPEEGAPAPDRLISGAPVFKTWNFEEADGGLYAGVWQSTPGKWGVLYEEWEYFHILEGHSILTEEGGIPWISGPATAWSSGPASSGPGRW